MTDASVSALPAAVSHLSYLAEASQFFSSLQTTAPMSFEAFVEFSRHFPNLRMEQEKNGQVTIMPPVFYGSATRESDANGLAWAWNRRTKLGQTISASGGIRLRDGSTKQADTAWISNERLAKAPPADDQFLFVEPDFIIEIRSKTDSLEKIKAKMSDTWIANGVRLAWLIDPYEEKAWVYRADGSIEVVKGFDGQKLSGEDVMPGFELELEEFKVKG